MKTVGYNGAEYRSFISGLAVKYQGEKNFQYVSPTDFEDITFREWDEIYFESLDCLVDVDRAFFKGVMVEKNVRGNWENSGCLPEDLRERNNDEQLMNVNNWRKITW